jgi:hypothetical protein
MKQQQVVFVAECGQPAGKINVFFLFWLLDFLFFLNFQAKINPFLPSTVNRPPPLRTGAHTSFVPPATSPRCPFCPSIVT